MFRFNSPSFSNRYLRVGLFNLHHSQAQYYSNESINNLNNNQTTQPSEKVLDKTRTVSSSSHPNSALNPHQTSLPTPTPTITIPLPSIQLTKLQPDRMYIQFTCNICEHINKKFMSKKSYTEGVVIIKCDDCKNNHLIADHMGWFDSQKSPGTIEDIMKAQGKESEVRRGCIGDSNLLVSEEEVNGLMELLPSQHLKKNET